MAKKRNGGLGLMSMALGWAFCAVAWAQYPGRVDTNKPAAAAPELRAVGVLEWTGEAGKPSASRLVPVTVYDGERLYDGGLYLARPQPLALDGGTEYELEVAGAQKGWFDVANAQQVNGDWFGFGVWKPFAAAPPKKLRPSREAPQVVHDQSGEDRPHFKKRGGDTAGSSRSSGQTGGQAGSSGSAGSGSAGSEKPAAPPAEPADHPADRPADRPVDSERPTLRHRPAGGETQIAPAPGAPETTINAPDPDRPRLSHGRPADLPTAPKELLATSAGVQQMVAVSDVRKDSVQTFHYEWGDPADAARVQDLLERAAEQLLAKAGGAKDGRSGSTELTSPSRDQARDVGHPARAKNTRRSNGTAARQAAPELEEVHFHAFALTNGGGATLVLTAYTAGDEAAPGKGMRRDIAVIALEDIYGKVQVLWSSITDAEHLDEMPRMRLVDAVDAEGKGRADLLFEARSAQDRRFVLLRVGGVDAERVFATDPLAVSGAGKSGPVAPENQNP